MILLIAFGLIFGFIGLILVISSIFTFRNGKVRRDKYLVYPGIHILPYILGGAKKEHEYSSGLQAKILSIGYLILGLVFLLFSLMLLMNLINI